MIANILFERFFFTKIVISQEVQFAQIQDGSDMPSVLKVSHLVLIHILSLFINYFCVLLQMQNQKIKFPEFFSHLELVQINSKCQFCRTNIKILCYLSTQLLWKLEKDPL